MWRLACVKRTSSSGLKKDFFNRDNLSNKLKIVKQPPSILSFPDSLEFGLAGSVFLGMLRESYLVCINVLFDTTHAAIINFDCTPVEEFVKYNMSFREFFIYFEGMFCQHS